MLMTVTVTAWGGGMAGSMLSIDGRWRGQMADGKGQITLIIVRSHVCIHLIINGECKGLSMAASYDGRYGCFSTDY